MKIGVIISQSKLAGGGPRLALELAQELKRQGHLVTLYTFRYSPGETYYEDLVKGLEIISLPESFSLSAPPIFGVPIPGTSALSEYAHAHTMARALSRLIDPDTEALNPHGSRSTYLTAHYFKKYVKKVPMVWQMNDPVTLMHKRVYAAPADAPKASMLQKILYRLIDAYDTARYFKSINAISVLDTTNSALVKKYYGREANVIRSGVDAKHFAYRVRPAPVGKKVHLLAHAQFFTHRRFEDAIQAVKILVAQGYDPFLVISGDCESYKPYREYRDRLSLLAEKLGIKDRISFPGKVSEEKLLEEFYTADIFLYPHHMQTWGLVVFEAMATGLPAIVSRTTGAHEVLTDRENTLLIYPQDSQDIARAIKELLEDPGLYKKISENAAAFVRKEITWENYAKGVVKLMKS